MKLVRAMKQVSRLQGEIKDLKHRASSCVSAVESNDYDEDFKILITELNDKTAKVIELKTRIMEANIHADMFKEILWIGELKKGLDFLREINIKVGLASDRYGDNSQVYKSQMTKAEKVLEIKSHQDEINKRIDALDEFNAKTDV